MEHSFKTTLSEVNVNKSTQQWKLQPPSSVDFQKSVDCLTKRVHVDWTWLSKKCRLNLAFKKCRLNSIIDEICVNTNTYAEIYCDKHPYSYKHFPEQGMTRLLFFKLLAILVYMALCPLSDYKLYWSRDVLYYNSSMAGIRSSPFWHSYMFQILTTQLKLQMTGCARCELFLTN